MADLFSGLHDELAGFAGDFPAAYITTDSFSHLTVDRLKEAIKMMGGKTLPAGEGKLSAVLRDVEWSTKKLDIVLVPSANPSIPDREVDVLLTSDLKITVDVFITNESAKIISNVIISIAKARIHLRAEDNLLILEGSEFDCRRQIDRLPNADQLLAAANIDPLEAARVEGHIGYGVITQAVTTALARRSEISLDILFPAINFGTAIKLNILASGMALGIIPTEKVRINNSAHCTCVDGPDFEVSRTTVTNTSPPNPGKNDAIGKIELGGPLPDNKDPLKDFGSRIQNRVGLVGLYIPRQFAEDLTVEAMPSIKVKASDNGTVGFSAEANVGFNNLRVSFDLRGGGILLDIDLDISISAYCDMELFKGLRVPIGWAMVMHEQGSAASVQLGFYPAVDNSGTVSLKSTLIKSDMGRYVAVVIGIGSALKLIGVTAWIGFLIDVVLSAIVSNGLPIALKKEIGKFLGKNEWKLIEGMAVVNPLRRLQSAAPFDVKATSLLASFDYKG